MQLRRFALGDEPALFDVYFSSVHEIASRDDTPEQIGAWAPADLDPVLWRDRMRCIQPFFARHGFEIVEQRQPVLRGMTIPNALMRKVLDAAAPKSVCYPGARP